MAFNLKFKCQLISQLRQFCYRLLVNFIKYLVWWLIIAVYFYEVSCSLILNFNFSNHFKKILENRINLVNNENVYGVICKLRHEKYDFFDPSSPSWSQIFPQTTKNFVFELSQSLQSPTSLKRDVICVTYGSSSKYNFSIYSAAKFNFLSIFIFAMFSHLEQFIIMIKNECKKLKMFLIWKRQRWVEIIFFLIFDQLFCLVQEFLIS